MGHVARLNASNVCRGTTPAAAKLHRHRNYARLSRDNRNSNTPFLNAIAGVIYCLAAMSSPADLHNKSSWSLRPSSVQNVLSLPPKWLHMYEHFITKNASQVSQIESTLRSLTYIIPGSHLRSRPLYPFCSSNIVIPQAASATPK
jgi:hypothetical protein